MKMILQRRALDKIYKRRDRYEIPDWQRGPVWDVSQKQSLIDTILRGWRLPKFYFVKYAEDQYLVVDGQQRLSAIYDFFGNELPLSDASAQEFGGLYYKDLKSKFSDAFDDFEIDYDEVEESTEVELKDFFQRLQGGLPLTGSEKLNSVHSKLRNFCKETAKHDFLTRSTVVTNTRFAHFDILSKVAVLEIEGIEAGLRFDDIKPVFESHVNFSTSSQVAKRLRKALDFLRSSFPIATPILKNRTLVQSIITLACRFVSTGKQKGLEAKFAAFIKQFVCDLSHQVELGQVATDYDFIRFQKSINANVKAGARIRQEILLRRAFMYDPALANSFDPSSLVESGILGRVGELGEAIAVQIARINSAYSATHGHDLFKATNKTVGALTRLRAPIKSFDEYKALISSLYFLFRESIGQRLPVLPQSFVDVNTLRTELQHDTDHGDNSSIRKKKTAAGSTFKKYSGESSPDLLDPERFVLVQANLLSTIDLDLGTLTLPTI